eukprot:Rmarinus@m.7025
MALDKLPIEDKVLLLMGLVGIWISYMAFHYLGRKLVHVSYLMIQALDIVIILALQFGIIIVGIFLVKDYLHGESFELSKIPLLFNAEQIQGLGSHLLERLREWAREL